MQDPNTMSTLASVREQGTHVFHICGYSQHRSAAAAAGEKRNPLSSSRFPVGGREWLVLFDPDASTSGDDIIAGLALVTKHRVKVTAAYELRLVDQSTGSFLSVHEEAPREFRFANANRNRRSFISAFMEKRSIFESPTYLRDDCLTMECIVTVFKEPWRTETKSLPKIQVPQSDIGGHYGQLLEEKVGVDVTFSVGGDEFTAHRVVLAARSPVFKAQLFGPMREGGGEAVPVTIKDIQPAVFRELLHFIYTDALPPFDSLKADARTDIIRHLLVAADRYGMERLSLMCQSMLSQDLCVQTVATTFALADRHHCEMLKDACLEFITCSTAMDAVKKTQGYRNLKRTCPPDVIEAFERTSRFRKA